MFLYFNDKMLLMIVTPVFFSIGTKLYFSPLSFLFSMLHLLILSIYSPYLLPLSFYFFYPFHFSPPHSSFLALIIIWMEIIYAKYLVLKIFKI